jgi:polyvinyl alcohol dehydrogenase (cytochrome)
MSKKSRRGVLLIAAVLLLPPGSAEANDWPVGGQNRENTRSQESEYLISPKTAPRLRVRWAVQLKGNVEATPAVDHGFIYVPDESGFLYKIEADTGRIAWSYPVARYSGIEGDVSRVTPTVTLDSLIFGTQSGGTKSVLAAPAQGWLPDHGAWLVAVDKNDGHLLWRVQVDSHPAARINQGAVLSDDFAYVGITSFEEVIAGIMPGYQCCAFRGSVVAVDIRSGKLIWKTYTTPKGYSGNAVWGSTPVYDRRRGQVYVTTGNNYALPDGVQNCVQVGLDRDDSETNVARDCFAPGNYLDSVLALDAANGLVKWARGTVPLDAHTRACITPLPNVQNCPLIVGPDYDFAQGPMLFTIDHDRVRRQLLGAGQKSGVFWALDPNDGSVVWKTTVGPGGITGGMQWGSATDGQRIYVGISNHGGQRWKLEGSGAYAGQIALRGFWSALDAGSGAVIWQTPDPNATAMDQGMLSVANNVVFAGSMAGGNADNMFALDAGTGDILWRFPSVGSVVAGAAIVDGKLYWGSGYSQWDGTPHNVLYSFELR